LCYSYLLLEEEKVLIVTWQQYMDQTAPAAMN
jgi:hypothetical protein